MTDERIVTDEEDSAVRQRMEPVLVTGFLFVTVFLLLFAHPLALLPTALNFEQLPMRLLVMSGLAIVALLLGIAGWKRHCKAQGLYAALSALTGLLIVFMPPGAGSKLFSFSLPVLLLMVPASLAVLILKRVILPRPLTIATMTFSAFVTIQIVRNPGNADLILPFYSLALIPVAISVLLSQKKLPTRYLEYAGVTIFLFSVGYGLFETAPVGISGNPNWVACTLTGVLPWVVFFANRRLPMLKPVLRWMVIAGIILAPAAWVLYKCHTRALYVAIGFIGLVTVCFALKRLWQRIAWVVVCSLILAGSGIFYIGHVKRAVGQDIRIPMWFSCLRLASQDTASALTGVGPRNIQYALPDLLAESGYHKRFVASEWVQHPHNEWMYIVINLGFPAGIAWLMLLIPLLTNPLKLKGLVRVAWFSALLMLILGSADKGLHWGPAILWFPICLGILWGARVPRTPVMTPDKTGRYSLGFLSLAVLSGVVVSYFAYHQISSSWYDRRGDQFSAFGRYNLARTTYLKALSHVPNDTTIAYKIAGTSLQKITPFNPTQVQGDIMRSYQMNPNFAHINIFMGRYLLMTGRKAESVDFFLRDIELFPENVKSHQWLVHSLLISQNLSLLDDAQRALHRKYYQRVFAFADIRNKEALPVSWLSAFDEHDWNTAVGDLNTFLPAMDAHRSIDPMEPWNSKARWPADFIGITAHPEDIPFWESVLFRERFRDEHEGRSDDPAALIWQILDQASFTESENWTYPHTLWKSRKGSIEGGYSLLAWLSPHPVLILTDANSHSVNSALIFPNEQTSPVIQVYLKRRMVKFLSPDELKAVAGNENLRLSFPALPHEFLTRHHVLFALAEKVAGYRKQLKFATIPSIKYLKLRERYPNLPRRLPCWQPPVEAIRQGLTQQPVEKEK